MAIEKAPAIQQRVNLDQQPIRQKENPAVSKPTTANPVSNEAPKVAEKSEKASTFATNASKSALQESENAVKDGFEAIAQKAKQIFNNVIAPPQPPAVQAQEAAPKNDQVAQTQAKDNQGIVAASNNVVKQDAQAGQTSTVTTEAKTAIQDISQQVKEAPTVDAPTSAISAPKAPDAVKEESSSFKPAAQTPGEAPTISKILDDNLAALRKAQASPAAQAEQPNEASQPATATA